MALDEPVLMGIGGGFGPRIDVQLAVDVGDVTRRRRRADEQVLAHLAVAVPGSQQTPDLQLARSSRVNWRASPPVVRVESDAGRGRRVRGGDG